MTRTARIRKCFSHYGLLLLGSLILTFGLFNVHSQCEITEGGVLGMTLLLHHWFDISPGISGPCMDMLCYIVGFSILGKQFIKNAVFSSVCFFLLYGGFERLGYVLPNLSEYPLAAAILGGIFVGMGVGIIVREGGASGGDDALGLVISKLTRLSLGKSYFITDFTVLALSLSYIPVKNIVFSLITVTISSFIIGKLHGIGPIVKKTTNKYEEQTSL